MKIPDKAGKFEHNSKGFLRYQLEDLDIKIQLKGLTQKEMDIVREFMKNFSDYFKTGQKGEIKLYNRSSSNQGTTSTLKGLQFSLNLKNVKSKLQFTDFMARQIAKNRRDTTPDWTRNIKLDDLDEIFQDSVAKQIKNKVTAEAV